MDVWDAYQNAIEALEKNRQLARDLVEEHERLKAEVEGLELALRRHGVVPGDEALVEGNQESQDSEIRSLSRPEAIKRVLATREEPWSPKELAAELQQRGRDDSPHYVSASLNYLRRNGLIESVGRGRWKLSIALPDLPKNKERPED